MKTLIECADYAGIVGLEEWELLEVSGGDVGSFFYDILYAAGATARYTYEFIKDNIEHPIGAEGGYPPR